MVCVCEIVSTQQVRGVAEQPRAHRVALAGDGVGSRAVLANVARHEGEIDDALGRPDPLMALVDA